MVLVIDAQQDFYTRERTDVDALHEMFARAAWLVDVASRLGVPVVVIEEDASLRGATACVIRDALPKDAPVFPKWTFGADADDDILATIEATGADTNALVGLETDVSVTHSALGLKERGKRSVAMHDALYSPGIAQGNGLGRMERAGVELVSAKELVCDWLRMAPTTRAFFLSNPDLEDPAGFSLWAPRGRLRPRPTSPRSTSPWRRYAAGPRGQRSPGHRPTRRGPLPRPVR